jgi:hypothetical protein
MFHWLCDDEKSSGKCCQPIENEKTLLANCTPCLCTNQTFPVHFFKVQQFYKILLKPKEQQKNIEPIGGSSPNGPLANHTTYNVTLTDATVPLPMV